ncbi:Uncharacterised protein [Mycobacteroides abscessus]|nr:Uncharacterised protein [Mycobacteroides abscessus]
MSVPGLLRVAARPSRVPPSRRGHHPPSLPQVVPARRAPRTALVEVDDEVAVEVAALVRGVTAM